MFKPYLSDEEGVDVYHTARKATMASTLDIYRTLNGETDP